ncbi:MAG: tetratricopeptide repeat protein [Gammaproteobacteria bacterium]|nr:tetratricopeptide repeat protein [Gammaproteobacteria bacterium]
MGCVVRTANRAVNVQDLLQQALAQHQSGRFEEAAASCREVLKAHRDNVDALHFLALTQRERGAFEEAQGLLLRVVKLRPKFAAAHGNLGLVYADRQLFPQADAAYRRALALNAELPETWFNLGNLLRATGKPEEAIVCYGHALQRKALAGAQHNLAEALIETGEPARAVAHFRAALELAPQSPLIWHRLGSTLQSLGAFEAALPCLFRATQQAPDSAAAQNDFGNALNDFGRTPEAAACYERALALKPGLIEAWNNLGNAQRKLGLLREAEASFRRALAEKPDFAEAYLNLGIVLKIANRAEEAIYCFREALIHQPGLVQAHNNLGVVFTEGGRHAEAIAELQSALAIRPQFAEAWNNLGNVYKNAGELPAALEAFAQALEYQPDYTVAHSNYLFTLNFIDGVSADHIAQAHRDWGLRHVAGIAVGAPYANSPEPHRRLKIAYISPDFRHHACAFFIEPLLREHDRSQVEVYAYAELAQPDAMTLRLKKHVDVWRSITGLPDQQVAEVIRADGIDVLIDLAGHTANGRLLTLARRPAPVQVTYLGYPATTGLTAIDWRLTDGVTEPTECSDAWYTEQLYRLPHSLWCYQPFADMGPSTALPALARGQISFGSFNSYAKIGPRVVALWAAVLRALPNARLVMITVPAGDAQELLWQEFARLEIPRERVALHERLPRAAYVKLFSEVDIALDPFPCNGGTTTCDALWMGLPVVALQGDTFLSRASLSVLTAAGCAEFSARDERAYVERCVGLAADWDALSTLRHGLRARLSASALLNAPAFARDIELAYRHMWMAWCAGTAPPVASA